MREIKRASSHWMHEACAVRDFAWQEGYGAFSIGRAQISATLSYIERQKEHHQRIDFQAEFIAFLKKHSIEFDPRYVWGGISNGPTGRRRCAGAAVPGFRPALRTPPWATFLLSLWER